MQQGFFWLLELNQGASQTNPGIFEARVNFYGSREVFNSLVRLAAPAIDFSQLIFSAGVSRVLDERQLKFLYGFLAGFLAVHRIEQQSPAQAIVSPEKTGVGSENLPVLADGKVISLLSFQSLCKGHAFPRRLRCNLDQPDHGLKRPIAVQ